jgi:hypothetical protein
VDPGSGATVCQPVSGCRLTGDFCLSTNACCGGGLNPNGTVQCRLDAVGSGRCDNGNSCNGVGNICGAPHLVDGGLATYPDGGIIRVNAPQDCCDGHQQVCRVDSSGVPRCFGGGSASCPAGYTGVTPCCIQTNQLCQFSDQCCGGAKCLPGDGGFSCTVPTCFGLGTTCNPGPSSNCCNGTSCLGTSSPSGGYACQLSSGPDGGGTCAANGSACDAGVGCCSNICSSGACQAPGACQPLNGSCTSVSDCCSGLSCSIVAGSTSGTCQQGSCPGAGQTCSASAACCSGLVCLNTTTYLTCAPADPLCTCNVRLN